MAHLRSDKCVMVWALKATLYTSASYQRTYKAMLMQTFCLKYCYLKILLIPAKHGLIASNHTFWQHTSYDDHWNKVCCSSLLRSISSKELYSKV